MEESLRINIEHDAKAGTQYIITGAYGYVGREIAVQLCDLGYRVRGLVHNNKPYIPMPEEMELIAGDLLAPDSLDALFQGLDPQSTIVIHTAARISVRKNDMLCERVNLIGTQNLIEACKRHGVCRLIHFGSVDALLPREDGLPIIEPERFIPERMHTAYERSKAAAAQRVLDACSDGLDCTLLLPSAIIGPGDYSGGFITRMLTIYLSRYPRVSIQGGYEFVDVRDIAAAAINASKKRGDGACYILSNRYAEIKSIFDTLAAYANRKKPRLNLPLWVLDIAAPPYSAACILTGREPPLSAKAVRLIRTHPTYNHEKAAIELGFSPRPLEQSVIDTAEFIFARNQLRNSNKERNRNQELEVRQCVR